MSHTDLISDMLTRIRNAVRVAHETVEIPASKIKIQIAEILKKEGYINSYELLDMDSPQKKRIKVYLKYGPRGEKLITYIERISKPGRRIYTNARDAERVLSGLGILVVSTSKGLKTDREIRKENIGGEIICKVW